MTQQQYIISRKLNILELGQVLGNISEACRRLGVSRRHYYDIKQVIEEDGLEGLLEKSRRASRIGNRVSPCYIGYIKGIGRLYQQTSIDPYSNIGFAKIYLEKTSLTAADFMNDKVLPFFDKEGIIVLRVLMDRGTEYWGELRHTSMSYTCT